MSGRHPYLMTLIEEVERDDMNSDDTKADGLHSHAREPHKNFESFCPACACCKINFRNTGVAHSLTLCVALVHTLSLGAGIGSGSDFAVAPRERFSTETRVLLPHSFSRQRLPLRNLPRMATDGLDLDAFAALMEEEGEPDAGVGVVDDGEDEVGERELEPVPLHDAPVAPEKKGVGRLYPVRKPGVATTAVKGTAASGAPHRTAGSGAGSLPSYMRGTATSDVRAARSRSPAAHDADNSTASTGASTGRTGYGGSGSSASHSSSAATATGGRRPSGATGKPAEPKIAGKPLFSGLPENAARAELIRNVEACITEAATLGPDGKPAGVTLDDVVGLEDAKRALEEAIVFPRVMMEMGTPGGFTKGVLLFGPPGTGKTQIARAQATCSGCCFIAVSPAVLISKWMGDSERMVKALFETAHYYAPAIVFIVSAGLTVLRAACLNPRNEHSFFDDE